MTIEQAKKKLLAWASAQVGYHEGPNNNNQYAPGMDSLYGWNVQNQPWCDIFVDAGFIRCFGYDLGSAMTYQFAGCAGAACKYSADYYRARGAFYSTPEIGDQIFFYASGDINHTGLVENVAGGRVYTIEGNSSDSVARRSYALGAGNIAGYGRPNWKLVEKLDDPDEGKTPSEELKEDASTPAVIIDHTDTSITENRMDCEITVTLPIIRYGAIGMYVKIMQVALIAKGYSCGWCGADGEYGNGTKLALTSFQSANGLTADGDCGKDTWTKLLSLK